MSAPERIWAIYAGPMVGYWVGPGRTCPPNTAEYLRADLATSSWPEDVCETFAAAYDREDAAQRGEPDPWTADDDEDGDTWRAERVACVRAGLEAVAARLAAGQAGKHREDS